VGQEPAFQITPELLFDVIGYGVAQRAQGIGLVGQGEVGLQVLPDDAVQRGGLGAAPTIGLGMGAGRWPGWWCRPPGFPVSGAGLCGHWRPSASRKAGSLVSTSRTADGWGGRMGGGVGEALRPLRTHSLFGALVHGSGLGVMIG